jgi:sulfonate transport system permease protein
MTVADAPLIVPAPSGKLRENARGVLLGALAPAGILGLWWVATKAELVPLQTLVPPSDLVSTLIDMVRDGELGEAVRSSTARVLAGGALGAILGVGTGVLIGSNGWINRLLSPIFYVLAQIPSVAWAPLLLMTLGIGEGFKVAVIGLAALFPVAINTLEGLRGVPPKYLEVARVLRLSRGQTVRRVVLPAIGPKVLAGLRIGFAKGWMTLVFAELFSASEGLGHLMDQGRTQFQMDVVLLAVFTTAILGFATDYALSVAAGRLPPVEV